MTRLFKSIFKSQAKQNQKKPMPSTPTKNIYEDELPKTEANFQALSPLSFFKRTAMIYPKSIAIVHNKKRLDYETFYNRSVKLAHQLTKMGIGKGKTVSVMLSNTPAMLEAHMGVPMSGAVLHTMNTRLDAETIAFQMDHAETKVLITDLEFSTTIKAALEKCEVKPIIIDYVDTEFEIEGERLSDIEYEDFLAGGGGTIWDSMAFDPELNLVYVGVGNGSPWSQKIRSPKGGDNLYLSSVVALNADTGSYHCHYQTTPGDTWDYTSTQQILLDDIELDGKKRKVFMHAPKNGFFFVIDRKDCSFISAKPFVKVTWATGHDKNGKAIVAKGARYENGTTYEAVPSAYGAHSWHSMSYNPQTGLVYIPAQGIPLTYTDDPNWKLDTHVSGQAMSGLGWNLGVIFNKLPPKEKPFGQLLAWDPVKQKPAWKVQYASPWNGGTLTTAGNLVFQGTADGRFVAYDAKNGQTLWQTPVGTGVVAAPITWEHKGKQYVSVAVGWGGVYGQLQRATETAGPGRIYTFAVGDSAKMPELVKRDPANLVSGVAYKKEDFGPGAGLYVANCLFCHGVPGVNNGGNIPNLGYSSKYRIENLHSIVLTGALQEKGMPNFKGKLTKEQTKQISAFIQGVVDSLKPKSEE